MVTTDVQEPKLHASWKKHLAEEFKSQYFKELKAFLLREKTSYEVYPKGSQMFAALNHTPLEKVRVVILGQDPYHGPGQANGFSFSVNKGIKIPPSLQNMYKELHQDVGFHIPEHGDLTQWADQGVLLLNATLSVRKSTPGSHQNRGWEQFTDKVIQTVSTHTEHTVFLLWGRFAQNKSTLIEENEHLILTAPHPSPFSAHKGFFGCKHFSKTNAYLEKHGKGAIDWQLQ